MLAPSNPFVSLDPILAVEGVRDALDARRERVVAISPIIAGRPSRGRWRACSRRSARVPARSASRGCSRRSPPRSCSTRPTRRAPATCGARRARGLVPTLMRDLARAAALAGAALAL